MDIYGKNISLTYNGQPTYKTIPGTIASIILFLVVLTYAALKGNILFNKLSPTVTKDSFFNDLDTAGSFDPFNYNFDIAFGTGELLDPTLAY